MPSVVTLGSMCLVPWFDTSLGRPVWWSVATVGSMVLVPLSPSAIRPVDSVSEFLAPPRWPDL
jgi:hypothetical protein